MDATGADPAEALESVTYEGEAVVDAVALAAGVVGVTSHRVLVYDPGGTGPTLRETPRVNVRDVAVRNGGDARMLGLALRAGVVAAALLVGSLVLEFDSMARIDPPASAAGPGQVIGMAVALTRLLPLVDDGLAGAGGVVLLGALVLAGRYWLGRERQLVVSVAGDEPLVVPLRPDEPVSADRLQAAVEKASNPTDG